MRAMLSFHIKLIVEWNFKRTNEDELLSRSCGARAIRSISTPWGNIGRQSKSKRDPMGYIDLRANTNISSAEDKSKGVGAGRDRESLR